MAGSGGSARKLEWVEARVENYEKMKKFYRTVLGLPLNFEEERKDFIQYKVGQSKTYLALLDTVKTGMTKTKGFVPTFEVSNLDRFVKRMKDKKVKDGRRRPCQTSRFLRPQREHIASVRMETKPHVNN